MGAEQCEVKSDMLGIWTFQITILGQKYSAGNMSNIYKRKIIDYLLALVKLKQYYL